MKERSFGLDLLDKALKYYTLADYDIRAYFTFRVLDILYNFKKADSNKIQKEEVSQLFPDKNIEHHRKFINRLRNKFLYDNKLAFPDDLFISSIIDELIIKRKIDDDPDPLSVDFDLIKNQINLIIRAVEFINGNDGLLKRFGIKYTSSDQDIYEELIEKLKEEIQNYSEL